jgi:hypothetical protein
VLAPLLRFYTYPRLAQAPLDQFTQTVAKAEGATYLDVSTVSIKTEQTLTATRRVVGDVRAGNDDTAVWDVFLKIEDDTGKLITATTDRVAFDRRSSQARNCCGENVNGQPVRHEGIEYKFPFDTQKRTYDYFDTTLRRALPMEFRGTERSTGWTPTGSSRRSSPRRSPTSRCRATSSGAPAWFRSAGSTPTPGRSGSSRAPASWSRASRSSCHAPRRVGHGQGDDHGRGAAVHRGQPFVSRAQTARDGSVASGCSVSSPR